MNDFQKPLPPPRPRLTGRKVMAFMGIALGALLLAGIAVLVVAAALTAAEESREQARQQQLIASTREQVDIAKWEAFFQQAATTGFVKRVDSTKATVYVEVLAWASMPYPNQRDFAEGVAAYFTAQTGSLFRFRDALTGTEGRWALAAQIHDYQSGRQLATYHDGSYDANIFVQQALVAERAREQAIRESEARQQEFLRQLARGLGKP